MRAMVQVHETLVQNFNTLLISPDTKYFIPAITTIRTMYLLLAKLKKILSNYLIHGDFMGDRIDYRHRFYHNYGSYELQSIPSYIIKLYSHTHYFRKFLAKEIPHIMPKKILKILNSSLHARLIAIGPEWDSQLASITKIGISANAEKAILD